MGIVLSEFHIGKYAVLKVDSIPSEKYTIYEIGGRNFPIVPVYDIPNAIAIESSESFVGKTVKFKA